MKASLFAAPLLGAALFVTTSDAAAAGHASGFGEKGQLILSAERFVPLFGYTRSAWERSTIGGDNVRETSASASGLSLLFGRDLSSTGDTNGQPVNMHSIPRVAFDFTITNHLTLGAALAFGFGLGGSSEVETVNAAGQRVVTKTDAPTFTAIGLAPRIGYIIPLGEHFAFWPRAGFAFYSLSAQTETALPLNIRSEIQITDSHFSIDLDPQLAIIPVEHFFITVGPMLNIPISGNRSFETVTGNQTTQRDDDISVLHFGLHAGIGGWLNLF